MKLENEIEHALALLDGSRVAAPYIDLYQKRKLALEGAYKARAEIEAELGTLDVAIEKLLSSIYKLKQELGDMAHKKAEELPENRSNLAEDIDENMDIETLRERLTAKTRKALENARKSARAVPKAPISENTLQPDFVAKALEKAGRNLSPSSCAQAAIGAGLKASGGKAQVQNILSALSGQNTNEGELDFSKFGQLDSAMDEKGERAVRDALSQVSDLLGPAAGIDDNFINQLVSQVKQSEKSLTGGDRKTEDLAKKAVAEIASVAEDFCESEDTTKE